MTRDNTHFWVNWKCVLQSWFRLSCCMWYEQSTSVLLWSFFKPSREMTISVLAANPIRWRKMTSNSCNFKSLQGERAGTIFDKYHCEAWFDALHLFYWKPANVTFVPVCLFNCFCPEDRRSLWQQCSNAIDMIQILKVLKESVHSELLAWDNNNQTHISSNHN